MFSPPTSLDMPKLLLTAIKGQYAGECCGGGHAGEFLKAPPAARHALLAAAPAATAGWRRENCLLRWLRAGSCGAADGISWLLS
jgi:hypothetical protein